MQHKTRDPSDIRKPKRAGNISTCQGSNAALPHSVCVCVLCVQLCYIMLLLEWSKLDISVPLHLQHSNTSRLKRTQQVTVLCVKLSLNFDRRENIILHSLNELCGAQSSSLWDMRSSVTTLYMCPHTATATCTTSTLFESGWKMSGPGSMNQPASQQCLHCVRRNVTDFFEHLNACWDSYLSADKMLNKTPEKHS